MTAEPAAFDRAGFSALFARAYADDPPKATVAYIKGIELLLKQGRPATQEVRTVYALLSGSSEQNLTLHAVLHRGLPKRYHKVQYLLRVYAIRSWLREDLDTLVSPEVLNACAGDKDIGRIAVIDFVLTRSRITQEHIFLVRDLYNQLENKQQLEKHPKRLRVVQSLMLKLGGGLGDQVAEVPSMSSISDLPLSQYTCSQINSVSTPNGETHGKADAPDNPTRADSAHSDSHQPLVPADAVIPSARTGSEISSDLDRFKALTDSTIVAWLDSLRPCISVNNVHANQTLSHALTNLGARLKTRPIMIQIWSLAVEIECKLPKPTAFIYNKLKKFVFAAAFYSDADLSALPKLFELCVHDSSSLSSEGELSDKELQRYKDVAFNRTAWSLLQQSLVFGTFTNRCKAAQILLIGASKCLADQQDLDLDVLMPFALKTAGPALETELHQAFFVVKGFCYDRQRLEELAKGDANRDTALCILAKSAHSIEESYALCLRIGPVEGGAAAAVVKATLMDLSFISVARRLTISLETELERVPLSVLRAPKTFASPIEEIHAAETAYISLSHRGCYKAALRFLKRAAHLSRCLCGFAGVRELAYMQLLQQLTSTFESTRDFVAEVLEDVSATVIAPSSQIWQCIDWYLSRFRPDPLIRLQEFRKAYEKLDQQVKEMTGTNLDQLLICSAGTSTSSKLQPLARRAQLLYSKGTSVSQDVDWICHHELSHQLHTLLLLQACAFPKQNLSSQLVGMLSPLEAFRNSVVQANRTFYSGVSPNVDTGPFIPPEDTLCVAIDFDRTALVITRHESDQDAVSVRVPLDPAARACIAQCYKVIADGLEALEGMTQSKQKFWEFQQKLQCELVGIIKSLETYLLGPYWPLFSPTRGVLKPPTTVMNHLAGEGRSFAEWECAVVYQNALQGHVDAVMKLCACSKTRAQIIIEGLVQMQPQQPSSLGLGHIILVCDRTACRVPWETFACFAEHRVTRAVSLHQVNEWMLSETAGTVLTHRTRYIVNPDDTLGQTGARYENELAVLNATGINGRVEKNQVIEKIRESTSFIYIGHGAGRRYLPSTTLRKMYQLDTSVFLFGCSSLEVEASLYDNDTVTDYAVAGASCYLGTLWPVRDKDENRFTSKFLELVFNQRLSVSAAVVQAKKNCLLEHLTAGAHVVYGLR